MEGFLISFFRSSIAVSLITASVLLVKRVIGERISCSWNFGIWYIVIAVMLIPVIPFGIFNFSADLSFGHAASTAKDLIAVSAIENFSAMAKAEDFYISVNRLFPDWLFNAACAVYLFGAAAVIISFTRGCVRLNCIVKNSDEPESFIADMLCSCKHTLNVSKDIRLVMSDKIKSPLITGIKKPVIVLPKSLSGFTEAEIKYMVLHELGHYKNRDVLLCCFLCFLQAAYWFNPIVWFGLKAMKSEMEVKCDKLVIKSIGEGMAVEYGMTIIRFAKSLVNEPSVKVYAGFGSSKRAVKKRIESIASFSADSFIKKLKGAAVFMAVLGICLSQLPAIVNASDFMDGRYSNWEGNTVYQDLSGYFNGYDGCFVMLDSQTGEYLVYNRDLAEKRVPPNSTFKIYSAAFALKDKVITPESSTIKWDGQDNYFDSWNSDQNLESAMKNSVNWYFKTLNKKLGYSKLEHYLKEIGYGNCDLSGGNDFWLESSLKISAIEQTELLNSLFSNKFGLDTEDIGAVKNAMEIYSDNGTTVYGKTGTGSVNGKNINGSFVGCVSRNGKDIYFAVNLSSEGSTGAEASEIALQILKGKGVI